MDLSTGKLKSAPPFRLVKVKTGEGGETGKTEWENRVKTPIQRVSDALNPLVLLSYTSITSHTTYTTYTSIYIFRGSGIIGAWCKLMSCAWSVELWLQYCRETQRYRVHQRKPA